MVLDYNLTLFSFVFMRMIGCIVFNPMFGRKSVPVILKITLSFVLALFAYKLIPDKSIEVNNVLVYGFMLIKELAVGLIVSFIIQMFLSVLTIGGEYIDFNMGISMSKVYDPQSNISMAVTSSILTAMFMLIFFASNAHLTLIKLFVTLAQVAPYGDITFPPDMIKNIIMLFAYILVLSAKLALPIMAIEVLTELGVGVLMKAVPQINIFAVNIQLKVLIGFACIAILVGPYAKFIEKLIELIFERIVLVFGL